MTDQQPHHVTDTALLLEQSLRRAMALIGATGGAILLWDEEEQALATHAWVNQPPGVRTLRLRLGEGLSGTVAARRAGMVVNDYSNWSGAHRIALEHAPITAGIAEPLLVEGRLIGVINLHDGGADRHFSARDGELLHLFADQAALTIENARLYESAQHELTRRERVEATLRENEARYRRLVDQSPEAIAVHDGERFLYVNPACGQLFGAKEPAELLGMSIWDRIHPDDREQARQRRKEISEGARFGFEARRILSLRGESIPVEVGLVTLVEEGRPVHVSVIRDARGKVEAERGLMRRARHLEIIREIGQEITRELDLHRLLELIMRQAMALVETRSATVFLYDSHHDCFVPRAWSGVGDWFGEIRPRTGEGVVGEAARRRAGLIVNDYRSSPYTIPPILERTEIESVIAEPLFYRDELIGAIVLRDKLDGRPFDSEDLQVLNLFGAQAAIAIENARLFDELRDSYARLQEAQESLLRTEKLRSLGQMSAGIAHDLNNMLAAILGQVELLKLRVLDADIREALAILETAATDGAQVVRRLQDFARQRAHGPLIAVDLGRLVREVLEMTRPRWEDEPQRGGIRIQVRVDIPDRLHVQGVASEIREALTNIILNALDAMPKGGSLVLAAAPPGGEGTNGREGEAPVTAPWVELAIADSGIGMSEAVRARVFDPFFTTKGVKGTGLGLSVVYAIMERHGGRVRIDSRPGQGTTIALLFRPAEGEADVVSPPPLRTTGRRILFIDDDPAVRTTLVSLLRAAGHEVIEADGGARGLQLLEAEPELVITDLGMPDMTGWQVARALRAVRPTLPIILLTGWREEGSEEDGGASLVDRVLAKPIRLAELLQTIASLVSPTGS